MLRPPLRALLACLVGLAASGCSIALEYPQVEEICLVGDQSLGGGEVCSCDDDCRSTACSANAGEESVCEFCLNNTRTGGPGDECVCAVDCQSDNCADQVCCEGPRVDAGAECVAACQCASERCVDAVCCDEGVLRRPPGATCETGCDCLFSVCTDFVCCSAAPQPRASTCTGNCQCESNICQGELCCSQTSDLAAGTFCACDGECASGACDGDRCCAGDENVRPGDPCGCDADCLSGLCGNGSCCASGDRVPGGEACDEDCECTTGFCAEGTCCREGEDLPVGASCICDRECGSDVCDGIRCCLDGSGDREAFEDCGCNADCASGRCSQGTCIDRNICTNISVIVLEFPSQVIIPNANVCLFDEQIRQCETADEEGQVTGLCLLLGQQGLLVAAPTYTSTMFASPFSLISLFRATLTAELLEPTGELWPQAGVGYVTIFTPGEGISASVPEGFTAYYTNMNFDVVPGLTATPGGGSILVVGPVTDGLDMTLEGLDGRTCRDLDTPFGGPFDEFGMIAEDRIRLPVLDRTESFIDVTCAMQ
ncbi:MAG: hypothetical protein ACFCGT_00940 [Sandaracinaceae bacterium]